MRIGVLIQEQRDRIMDRWAEGVRALPSARGLAKPDLYDHVPELLDWLISWLDRSDRSGPKQLEALADLHARHRLRDGYELEEVIAEYRILRACILRHVVANQPDSCIAAAPHLIDLNEAIDFAVADTAQRYARAREQAVADSQARLFALIDNAPVVIFVKDREGRYVLINRAYERLFHVRREEVVGMTDYDLHPKSIADEVTKNDREVLATGKAIEREELVPVDGRPTTWLAIKFLLTHAGKPAVCGISSNITDRKLVENAREEFLGVLSHDLRTPLNAIVIAASLLQRSAHLPEAELRVAARIRTSAERMSRMIDKLLDFTRARLGGGIPLDTADANMAVIARNVVDELAMAHPHRDLMCHSVGDTQGRWDADRMAQVLSNLVGNALEHGEDPVRVLVRGEDSTVVVEVSNKGTPIGADKQMSLFAPFRKSADSEGLGLGLYIAKQIVAAHGGAVEVDSSERATVFSIKLPRRSAAPLAQSG